MGRIFVSTIQDSPGRVHVAIKDGSGVDTRILRKELSPGEMQHMHEVLTKALWDLHRRQGRP